MSNPNAIEIDNRNARRARRAQLRGKGGWGWRVKKQRHGCKIRPPKCYGSRRKKAQ